MGIDEWVSSFKCWFRELDPQTKELLSASIRSVIGLYLAYKLQMAIQRAITNPKHSAHRAAALKILRAAGYCKVSARRIMRQLTEYELIILQDLVTNQTKLTKMEDIKGLKKAKDSLHRNLKLAAGFKKHKDLSKLIEITPGVLLYGPPGCGKTMMARAVASDIGFRFLVVKPSVINDKYIGETEKRIQAIFSLALKLEPIVIFIDEIEVLLGNRGGDGSHSDFKETKIGEFLTAWDGFGQTNASVVVMGATNRKGNLDDAILRRLPLQIEIPLPDRPARKEIFESILKKEKIKLEANFEHYLDKTDQWNASKITNFLKSVLTAAAQAAISQEENSERNNNVIEKTDKYDLSKNNLLGIGCHMALSTCAIMAMRNHVGSSAQNSSMRMLPICLPLLIYGSLPLFLSKPQKPDVKEIFEENKSFELIVDESHFSDAFDSFRDSSLYNMSSIYN